MDSGVYFVVHCKFRSSQDFFRHLERFFSAWKSAADSIRPKDKRNTPSETGSRRQSAVTAIVGTEWFNQRVFVMYFVSNIN